MNKLTCQLGFVVAVAALISGCCTFHEEGVAVQWDSVPAVVQDTIHAHQYGGTVIEIVKETMKRGVVYEAEVKGPDGRFSEVKVTEDGKLLKYKTCKKGDKD